MKKAIGLPSVRPWRNPPLRHDVVGLELLARAAAVTRLAPGQVTADQLVVELEAGRHAADHDGQPRAVGFAGCDVGELHGPRAYPPGASDLRKYTRSNPSS